MQVLCGLQGIFLIFNCQTPGMVCGGVVEVMLEMVSA